MTYPDFHNYRNGDSPLVHGIRVRLNRFRTFIKFRLIFPWVRYKGFVRVMKGSTFAKGMDITIGNNVQFGQYCDVATDAHFGNNILVASKVSFVGRRDHCFDAPGKTIWQGTRADDGAIMVQDDVWIGAHSVILSGVTIGRGSIVAAGSVVTKNIPPCEIWGGNPAHKLKDRFSDDEKKKKHLDYLNSLS